MNTIHVALVADASTVRATCVVVQRVVGAGSTRWLVWRAAAVVEARLGGFCPTESVGATEATSVCCAGEVAFAGVGRIRQHAAPFAKLTQAVQLAARGRGAVFWSGWAAPLPHGRAATVGLAGDRLLAVGVQGGPT